MRTETFSTGRNLVSNPQETGCYSCVYAAAAHAAKQMPFNQSRRVWTCALWRGA